MRSSLAVFCGLLYFLKDYYFITFYFIRQSSRFFVFSVDYSSTDRLSAAPEPKVCPAPLTPPPRPRGHRAKACPRGAGAGGQPLESGCSPGPGARARRGCTGATQEWEPGGPGVKAKEGPLLGIFICCPGPAPPLAPRPCFPRGGRVPGWPPLEGRGAVGWARPAFGGGGSCNHGCTALCFALFGKAFSPKKKKT